MGKALQAIVIGATGVLATTGLIAPPFLHSAFASDYTMNGGFFSSLPNHKVTIIEVAGADESDRATREQLRRAGTKLIPAEGLKKSSAYPRPIKTAIEAKKPKPVPTPPQTTVPEPQPTPVAQPEPTAPEPTVPEPTQVSKPQPASAPQPSAPTKMADTISGPYLRLDLGYGFARDSDGSQLAGQLRNGSVANAALMGGGIGYRLSEKFRSDVTFSYRPDASVTTTTAAGNTTTSEVNGLSIMANGYWDITKLDQVTPYVGAGLGYARLSTSTQLTTGGIANEAGASKANVAWALMLGGTIDINPEIAVDIGYRFINLGRFKQVSSTTYDALQVHEARAGVRYSF